MKWNKLEYGNWPIGEIVMRIKDDKDTVHFEHGYISRFSIDNEVYFYPYDAPQIKLSIDSIYDTEPHYIALKDIPMPEAEDE